MGNGGTYRLDERTESSRPYTKFESHGHRAKRCAYCLGRLVRPNFLAQLTTPLTWCWSFSSCAERARALEIVDVACLDYPLDRTNKRAGGGRFSTQNF